ncbi:hypothetical protein [Klebsiella sp. BIGb0407]|uniref:hypothetical protein n=1 Tax=Klebsiella sp. BIGb0407 TaxID=2940603 RepID=UPI00216AA8A8|nr:hypothetical protein [Klebsiella sp. BIGb0407]MCS3432901.1 hypothetical protein [Klebsiella sp. BIGb0407]
MLWISQGDIEAGRVSDQISADQIKIYVNGNPAGSESKSDVFLVHENSGYWQDGNFRNLNSVKGNATSASGSYKDARDTIHVQNDGKEWSAEKGPANVNGNINYVDNISVIINGHTVLQGSNQISDITSGEGGKGWDPQAPGSKTSWHHELNLDASILGGDEHDLITSITFSGLPAGSIKYNDQSYAVDANGNLTIDITDVTSLNGKVTFDMATPITLDDIKVNITTSVNGVSHDSGEIALSDLHHSISLSGQNSSISQENHDSETLMVSADEQHDSGSNMTHAALVPDDDTSDHLPLAALLIDSGNISLEPAVFDNNQGLLEPRVVVTEAQPESQLTNLLADNDSLSSEQLQSEKAAADPVVSSDKSEHDSSPDTVIIINEEPLSFSDIISDVNNNQSLDKLLQATELGTEDKMVPQILVTDISHDTNDTYGGGYHAQIDNLLAKPDTDS